MANLKEPFDGERLDDEIEKLSQIQNPKVLMETPDARLTNDLRRLHQREAEADVQSLSSVYTRLQAHERHMREIWTPSNLSLPLRKGLRFMNNPDSGSAHKSKPFSRSLLTMIAAVLLAAVLLTSTLWVFTRLHLQNGMSAGERIPAPQATPTPQPAVLESLYVSQGDTLSRLHAKTGTEIWHVTIPSTSLSRKNGPPLIGQSVVLDKLVYIADQNGGAVYAFNGKTGLVS